MTTGHLGIGQHRDDVGHRVLAESIELQQHVAQEMALSPLPPAPPAHGRRLAFDVLAVVVTLSVLTVSGWLFM
ncbi:MAG: hypothetical protein QOI54_1327 [Actinomycetota bacterium]|jgi:hypothetical protein|nr:hypothetical protein [Actinomycetota bacterium]